MVDYYKMLFKRKSFHLFRGIGVVSLDEQNEIETFIKTVKPLDESIHTEIQIVPESATTCSRGAQYCILFYSETVGNYLRNIGYIGEQIDLYLASQDIGALWFGIGRPKHKAPQGLEFVIMMAIGKMPARQFRKDMFKAKRKPLAEIWEGELIPAANMFAFPPVPAIHSHGLLHIWVIHFLFINTRSPVKEELCLQIKCGFITKLTSAFFCFSSKPA